jgi:acyl-CoA dehydrogenase
MQSAYGAELDMFRDTVRSFFAAELEPRIAEFERHGTDREFWRAAGNAGLLGVFVPEEFGGPGADPLAILVVSEELGRSPVGATVGSCLNSDMATRFLVDHGTAAQKSRWLPGIVTGDVIQALALTESEAGSDAAAIRTTAVREGDEYVLNGSKCFISNGSTADLIYVVARTDPDAGNRGISMLLVPGDTPGLTRTRQKTVAFRGGDTSELFFDDVRLPAQNLVGREGAGLKMFQPVISLDRMQICARSQGAAEAAFEMTLEYVRNRRLFGRRLIDFQNTQFKLAEMETEIAVGRAFLDAIIRKYREGSCTDADTSMLKIWIPEMEGRVLDGCLQFWGGNGFMDQSPIARMYVAARVQRIYAGATELQKALLGNRYLHA